MKLELKSIKHSAFASHETYCYQANLYVNGKAIAIVSNEVIGGCDSLYWNGKGTIENKTGCSNV